MFSAVLNRLRRLTGTRGPDSDEDDAATDDGPDLYECEGCGTVFISEPTQCSTCGGDEFANVGRFE